MKAAGGVVPPGGTGGPYRWREAWGGRFIYMGLFFGFVGVEWLGEVGGSEPQNVELRNIEYRREASGRGISFDVEGGIE